MPLAINKVYKTSFAFQLMATVIFIVKIMPESPEVNLEGIKSEAKSKLGLIGASNLSFEEKPIAFGLKAIFAKFMMPEEKGSDIVEQELNALKNVSSATIEDYRRAFG